MAVLIHQDMETYDHSYRPSERNTLPPPTVFNPRDLNTDQWLECAAAAGCRSAILVAKHASGFTFFPSKAHSYGVHSSPWRGGKGDVAEDFLRSCEKYGLKPGFYFSVVDNDFLGAFKHQMVPGAKTDWKEYTRLMLLQLRELWSKYQGLGELWFDGGMWPVGQGREELADLVNELQGNAVCFGGDPNYVKSVRGCGNEDGATLPWSHSCIGDEEQKDYLNNQRGRLDGKYYLPMESITPNRDNYSFGCGWFWHENEEHTLFRPEELVERYYTSVGHNAHYMLGMVTDRNGLIPEADAKQFHEFGRLLKKQFADKIGACAGVRGGTCFDIENPDLRPVNMVQLRENFENGERICRFKLFGIDGRDGEVPLTFGDGIGNCFMERFPESRYRKYRLRILDSVGTPDLASFRLYHAQRL